MWESLLPRRAEDTCQNHDVATLRTVQVHDLSADRVAGARDGRWIAVEADELVTLVHDGHVEMLPDPPRPLVGTIAFADEMATLLAAPARYDFASSQWSVADIASDTTFRTGSTSTRVVAAAWSHEGASIAWIEEEPGAPDHRIRWHDNSTVDLGGIDHWAAKEHIAVTSDDTGSRVLVVVASTFVEVWDPAVPSDPFWVEAPGRWQVGALLISDQMVIVGDAGGEVRAVGLSDGAAHWSLEVTSPAVALARIAGHIAVASSDGHVTVIDRDGAPVAHARVDAALVDIAAAGSSLLAAHAAPGTGVTELLLEL